ncbi:Zinc metalloproteinase [Trichostrongylus colubriformis]|uniref:Zinc metalloproteinase n=1 Tax=Trichostrongylus colubriformis TaxID=6319 RepID=A0AAN8IN94_TRICO
MKFWQDNTCVTFRPRTNETQYILYTSENRGCFSTVGRDTSQPAQPVNIGRGCQHFGITTHEIAHALGLFHHQQRYDRDEYITFNEENVQFRYWLNFAKIPSKYLDTYDLPYDVGSVMHYTPTEFSENEYLYALTAKDPNLQGTMGSMDGPSFLDVQIINRHYQCYDACNATENKPRCLNGGYVDPKNCTACKCPTGFGGDVCQLIASSAPIRCGGLIPTTSSLTRMRIRLSSGGPRRKCVYHIRAPPNRRVMIGLKSVLGHCQEGCYTTAVEMKMAGDFRPVGYRFCCKSQWFRRIISKGRNVPIIFFAQNSTLDVTLYYRWVVSTPDAEDATYLNSTQLSEVYKQTDDDNGLEMEILQGPEDGVVPAGRSNPMIARAYGRIKSKPSFDESDYVGEFGSDGESYEDFSLYS